MDELKEEAPKKTTTKKTTTKKTSPTLIIESLFGSQISAEDVLRRLPADAEEVYLKPDENKAYWTGNGKVGSIDLW